LMISTRIRIERNQPVRKEDFNNPPSARELEDATQ
jgi:hypothetical protein